MTHELKQIFKAYLNANKKGLKCVLSTVVALEGSSYRRPGVRMLLVENNVMIGAVSGGCVEKEVLGQAVSVFDTDIAKVITYDGRYRLGCEGLLFILIETFAPSKDAIIAFEKTIKNRSRIQLTSYFKQEVMQNEGFGTEIKLGNTTYAVDGNVKLDTSFEKFNQELEPCFKLMIVGAEHDAVQLAMFASNTGWEVSVIAHPTEDKKLSDFPGAIELQGVVAEQLDVSKIDAQTAVVLMTHSYVKDLQFMIALQHSPMVYLGLLGPYKRREKLLNEFLEHCPDIDDTFFDRVYGPAGLNIGGETPQEIAISILAEILAVIRGKEPMLLRDKNAGIHA